MKDLPNFGAKDRISLNKALSEDSRFAAVKFLGVGLAAAPAHGLFRLRRAACRHLGNLSFHDAYV